jgi:hypothetical protein
MTFKQPTHQKYTICTNACHAHILPAHISIWKWEVIGVVKCAVAKKKKEKEIQHTQFIRSSNMKTDPL